MESITITAEPRTRLGTRDARATRSAGRLPAIIYGHGDTPEAITLAAHEVGVALAHGARTLDVSVAGKTAPFLIKSVQYDHLDSTPIHLDLMRVDVDEKVQVRVGIDLKGVPAGAHDGGIVDQMKVVLEVECVISSIPETLHPTITHMKVGDSLLVKDVELPPGVVALDDPDDRIAMIRLPAAVKEEVEETPAEGEEETAEPERIGRVKKEEEEGSKSD